MGVTWQVVDLLGDSEILCIHLFANCTTEFIFYLYIKFCAFRASLIVPDLLIHNLSILIERMIPLLDHEVYVCLEEKAWHIAESDIELDLVAGKIHRATDAPGADRPLKIAVIAMPTVNEKILIALCVHIKESAQVVAELRNDSKVS